MNDQPTSTGSHGETSWLQAFDWEHDLNGLKTVYTTWTRESARQLAVDCACFVVDCEGNLWGMLGMLCERWVQSRNAA